MTANKIIEQLSGMTVRDATALLQEAIELLQYTEIGLASGKDRTESPNSLAHEKPSHSP